VLEHADRAGIVRRDDGDDARDAERARAVVEHRGRGLAGVALAPPGGQVGKADIHVFERVALKQAAHADCGAVRAQRHVPQAEAMALVARHRTVRDVGARIVELAHLPIADVAQEGGHVDEFEDERRVRGR